MKLVSKSELAKIAGCTAGAVTLAIKRNMSDALVGRKVDVDHKVIKAWLKKRAQRGTADHAHKATRADDKRLKPNHVAGKGAARVKRLSTPVIKKSEITAPPKFNIAELPKESVEDGNIGIPPADREPECLSNIEEFLDHTLRDILMRFGHEPAFADWLKASKMITDIESSRIKNAAARGKLVSRELVERGVIDPVDTCLTQMMTDGIKAIVRRTITLVKAGNDEMDCIKYGEKQIGSFVRPMKNKIRKAMINEP